MWSVAVVRKPARFSSMTFEQPAVELLDMAEVTLTLLIVWLHKKSVMFPDCYYEHSQKHFSLIHDTGETFAVGIPYVTLVQSC